MMLLPWVVILLLCLLPNVVKASDAGTHHLFEDVAAALSTVPVESISLNTDRNYAEYKENQPWAAVTELIQNLHDQAVVSCNYSAPVASYVHEQVCDEETWHFHCSDELTVNVASLNVEWRNDDEKRRSGIEKMTLINFDTELKVDAFVHGYSTKKETSELAGHFGDGLKKAVAKILAESAEILFYSGQYLMRPEYKYRSLFAKEVLHLSMYALQRPTSAVTIEVFNLPANAFDVTRYLYLQRERQMLYRAPGIGSVLPFTTNKVFLKGLLVQSETHDLQNTALNVELPTKFMIDHYDLGKERDSIGNRQNLALHVLFSMMDYHNYSNHELNEYVAAKLFTVTPATADRGIFIEENTLLRYAYSFLNRFQSRNLMRLSSLEQYMLPPPIRNMTIVLSTGNNYYQDHKELALVTDFSDVHHVEMSFYVHEFFRHRFMDIVAYKKDVRKKLEKQEDPESDEEQAVLGRFRSLVRDYFPCIKQVAYKRDSSGLILLDESLVLPYSYLTQFKSQEASASDDKATCRNMANEALADLQTLLMKKNPECATHKERELTRATLEKDFTAELIAPKVQQLVPVLSPKVPRVIARSPYSAPTFYRPPNTLPGERSLGFNLTRTSTANGSIVYVQRELLEIATNNDFSDLFTDDDVSAFLDVIDKAKAIIGSDHVQDVAINLFYQNSNVCGFNAHHIFLNLASFQHGDRSAVSSWAEIIMHELSHDFQRSHDVHFINQFGVWVAIALKNQLAIASNDPTEDQETRSKSQSKEKSNRSMTAKVSTIHFTK